MALFLCQHVYLPISMWKLTISLRLGWFSSGTCLSIRDGSSNTNQFQHYYTLENPYFLDPWVLMLSTILGNIRWDMCFSSPGSIDIPCRKWYRSVQTSYSSDTLLDGGSFASNSSQYVGIHSSLVSHCKGPCHGCLGKLGFEGSAAATFNLFGISEMCLYIDKSSLP